MKYTLSDIARIVGSSSTVAPHPVEHLLIDSRKIYSSAASLFVAIKGERRDGHQFVSDVYKKGVRSFLVSEAIEEALFPGAGFVMVDDTLRALQALAAYHRSRFSIPVIGITGSNGKTIVKEWLFQLLHPDFHIVRSPKSYNSQVGVPLSVWQMNEQHQLAIFEAGISRRGEMDRLERIIKPTIGVLTNIGEAHSEGFSSIEEKEAEKRILFRDANLPGKLRVAEIRTGAAGTVITAALPGTGGSFSMNIPFTDEASVQNVITCWEVLLMLGYDNRVIQERIANLHPVNMRLELKTGINHCHIINDSYSADLSSLEIALNFLDQQKAGTSKTVILSDFLQSGLPAGELYSRIAESLQKHRVERVVAVGENISHYFRQLSPNPVSTRVELFGSTEEFLRQFRTSHFRDETILVKGARLFEFERIVQLLEQKAHQTILEININAIVHNLKFYQRQLEPQTRVMVMVKAFAYGSGGAEIAGILQYHKVDYLGVAYADEGVELRKAGIQVPIMVMNTEPSAFESIVEYNLEPDIFSPDMLMSFHKYLEGEGIEKFPVHIELETGMNRLGFAETEIERLLRFFASASSMKVQSVFSHLAASEDPGEDQFTLIQLDRFNRAVEWIAAGLRYPFIRHIANSAAITRLPQTQLDMVRLGIGVYGVDVAGTQQTELEPVATLRSTIAQLKTLKAGESVSYNRKGVVQRDSLIATIRIGYADGFSRKLGNGVGKVFVKGRLAPVIGSVCMDMTMVDVTGINDLREGDDVIIFGKELPIQQVAEWAGTIPYEVMTGVSQRVKRVYFEE